VVGNLLITAQNLAPLPVNTMKIGVLAIQGDFSEHLVMLKRLGV